MTEGLVALVAIVFSFLLLDIGYFIAGQSARHSLNIPRDCEQSTCVLKKLWGNGLH